MNFKRKMKTDKINVFINFKFNVMKKQIFIILILFFSIGNAYSQYIVPFYVSMEKYNVVDSAYLQCTYRFTNVRDTLKIEKSRHMDIQTLLIGNKISKYFSQYMVDYCRYTDNLLKKKVDSYPTNKENGTCGFEVYKNYPDKKITVTDLATKIGGTYKYEEEIPNQKWEITTDTLTILSYLCQKAITTFRGRTFEAWFTADIPINNGPYKFGGLPGLILKVSDHKQYFVFECIGIEKLRKMEPIKFYNLKYTQITRLNLEKLYKRYHEDSAAFVLSNFNMKTVLVYPDGKPKEVKHLPKEPYNPIELE